LHNTSEPQSTQGSRTNFGRVHDRGTGRSTPDTPKSICATKFLIANDLQQGRPGP
jgi:hypothetical protein